MSRFGRELAHRPESYTGDRTLEAGGWRLDGYRTSGWTIVVSPTLSYICVSLSREARLGTPLCFHETSLCSRNRDRSTLVLLGLFEFWQQWRWRRRPITLALYKPHLVLSIYGSLPGAFSLSLSSTLPTAFDREKTAWRASTRLFCIQIVLSCSSFLPAVPPLYIDID